MLVVIPQWYYSGNIIDEMNRFFHFLHLNGETTTGHIYRHMPVDAAHTGDDNRTYAKVFSPLPELQCDSKTNWIKCIRCKTGPLNPTFWKRPKTEVYQMSFCMTSAYVTK